MAAQSAAQISALSAIMRRVENMHGALSTSNGAARGRAPAMSKECTRSAHTRCRAPFSAYSAERARLNPPIRPAHILVHDVARSRSPHSRRREPGLSKPANYCAARSATCALCPSSIYSKRASCVPAERTPSARCRSAERAFSVRSEPAERTLLVFVRPAQDVAGYRCGTICTTRAERAHPTRNQPADRAGPTSNLSFERARTA